MVPLSSITSLLDTVLDVPRIKDAPVALNGLQVENNGQVSCVALAVDGSQKTIDAAVSAGADLLLLHHGIYWCGLRPMTGWFRKKIMTCLENNLAIYSAHLPLDIHAELGNNVGIARGLGLEDCQPEVSCHGLMIGISGIFRGTVGQLREKYATLTGAMVTGYVKDSTAPADRVVVCSGGAGDMIYQLQEKGYKTYLTGEENHWVVNAAEDMGVNILFAGHYATETFGVRSLGLLLEKRFHLPTIFIDHPTDM